MYNKDEVIQQLHEGIHLFNEIWESSGDIEWQQAIDDKKHELEMTEEIPDDENFTYNRAILLEQHGFLQRSLDRLHRVLYRKIN
jgi:hypothetical protein